MRKVRLLIASCLFAVPALAGPADIPQFQYFYAVPGADLAWSVASAPEGTIRTAGVGTQSVFGYTREGSPLGGWPTGVPTMNLAVADDGTVWVTSDGGGDVRSYISSGSPLVTIPAEGGALATGPGGDVFVATPSTVFRFRPDGTPAGSRPFCISNGCLYVHLRGIAVGPDTTVYVAFDDSGLHFMSWFRPAGGSGALPWPWPARSPRGVALDPASGELFVSFHADAAGPDGVVKYPAAGDTVGTAFVPSAMVLGGITADGGGHLHVPTSLGVARFGLGTDPVRRTSWGAIKRLGH